jgi:hypothetical protein
MTLKPQLDRLHEIMKIFDKISLDDRPWVLAALTEWLKSDGAKLGQM